jgi:hypothetical protein
VLNRVFKGRWTPLPPGLNLQKRCFVHAPELYNDLRKGVMLLHFVGAKPWLHRTLEEGAPADVAAACTSPNQLSSTGDDWEQASLYKELNRAWWEVHAGGRLPSLPIAARN